jgi:hypothetical protein
VDAVGGDFDFGNAAEGERELYQVLGRLFRSLFHNVGNSVGDRGLEHDALGLQAGKVYAHELAWLQHDTKILLLRAVKGKPFPMIPDLQLLALQPADFSTFYRTIRMIPI